MLVKILDIRTGYKIEYSTGYWISVQMADLISSRPFAKVNVWPDIWSVPSLTEFFLFLLSASLIMIKSVYRESIFDHFQFEVNDK